MIATCAPDMAATKAARIATSVLPKPTSPHTRRSIGARRQIVHHIANGVSWSSVSVIGKTRRKRVPHARGRLQHGAVRKARSAATRINCRPSRGCVLSAWPFWPAMRHRPNGPASLRRGHICSAVRCSQPAGKALILCIFQQQDIHAQPRCRDDLHAHDTANAVIDMHHQIAGAQAWVSVRKFSARRLRLVAGSGGRPARPVPRSPSSPALQTRVPAPKQPDEAALANRARHLDRNASATPSSSINPVRRSRAPSE